MPAAAARSAHASGCGRRAALPLAGRSSSCHPDPPRRRVGLRGVRAPPIGPQLVASSGSRSARLAMSPRPRAGPPRVVGCDEPHPSTEPTRPARPALQAAFFARAHCSLLRLLLAALLRSLLRRDRALQAVFAAHAHCSLLQRCCDVARCSLLLAALLRSLLLRAGPPRVVGCNEPHPSTEPTRLAMSPRPRAGPPRVVGCNA